MNKILEAINELTNNGRLRVSTELGLRNLHNDIVDTALRGYNEENKESIFYKDNYDVIATLSYALEDFAKA